MLEVIRVLYTFHQHIVDVYFHGASNQVLEDFVNHLLESVPNILESKGHHLVAIDFPISDEGCLVFVHWVHLDLIVPRIGIHKSKELMACLRLY